ncbi:hypothetical protein V494_08572 [Pseudogymnoascus sp. VKM F-4513 (FW-928)]|nr:hypothetical protein V494_08572 [Pseudogymnoascus sp. VKM F-4513 (FW-928)]
MGDNGSSTSYGPFRSEPVATASEAASGVAKINDDTVVANYAVVVSRECVWNGALQQNIPRCCLATPEDDDTSTIPHYLRTGIVKTQGQTNEVQSTWDITTAIHGAWALVVARKTNSNYATYTASLARDSPKPVIQASKAEIVSAPVRIELSYIQSVSAYLQSVQRQVFHTQSCRDKKSQVDGASSYMTRTGNFRTLLILQQHDNGTLQDGNQLLESFDLVVLAHVSPRKILVSALFDSRTIEPSVADTYLSQLDHVASQLCQSHSDQLLQEIEIITPSQSKQLWEWNATVPASVQRCVHTLVEEKAQTQPTSMAVCAWDGDLTYKMLDQFSTALSTHLVRHGVGSDTLVPLCFHKSKWTPVAILAVLKAGGAFVLLDPSLPVPRLQAIVQQLAAKLIVSSKSNQLLSSRLVTPETPVVIVGPGLLSESEDGGNPGYQRARYSSTCYIVFTSGSTGTPKGIIITHENAASALHYHVQRLELTAKTRMFDFASYSTDVSISNLFLVWAAGGCLCVPKESDRNNNPEQSIVDLRANTIDMTPSLAHLLSPANIPQVTLIIFGGEALRVGDVERWWGRARIIHEYGSSECTQNSTMNCNSTSPEEVVRIGTGAGLVTWVVDSENHNILLPIGSIGELLLEGPLVGRGYLNDPNKTAAAFIEAPTWLLRGRLGYTTCQGRLYKSGDLVRYNDDGSLTFIDRKDGQAKIRGQRVDLGEVEHWVRACVPSTTEVAAEVVLPRGEHACSTLVVFLQANIDLMELCQCSTATTKIVRLPAEVEDKLVQHLPSYMIPTAFVFMDELPKTASGKMHRARLRQAGSAFSVQQLAESRTTEQSLKQQPASKAEQCMQAIWADVLNINASNIGLDDSFFHLGGDSIAAMRVVAEARKAGLCVAVADVFRHRQLQQVAASAAPLPDMVGGEIPSRKDQGPVQLSLDQERIWLQEQRCPGLACYLKPCAVRLQGPLDLAALNSALLALEKRHEALRTTFTTHDHVHIQQVQPFQPKAFSVVDLSSEVDCDRSLGDLLHKDQTTPFRLQSEPGWRASVYRCGEDDHVLSIVVHNIIADGWSIGVLSRELAKCYSAAVRQQDPLSQLEPLPIQYGDYSIWQRQQTQTARYQQQLDYWLGCLQTSHPAGLICDKPRPTIPSDHAGVQDFKIKDDMYGYIQKFCKEREVRPSIVMLSALAATHYRLTGVSDATIGTPYAGRDRWELRNLIGVFVNIHCIRIKVSNETFDSLVQQVQATTITAFANQDVPNVEIASRLQGENDTSRHPHFQTVFTFNNSHDLPEFKLEGVKSQLLHTIPTTRDDLEFNVIQKEGALEGQVFFSTDIYEPQTISNMLNVFQNVLEEGLKNAKHMISS